MISIDLGQTEYYDGEKNEFVYEQVGIVRFEYSLKMIYDWEAVWKKPFLKGELTDEEVFDFYKRMALDPVKDEFLTTDVAEILAKYISDSHTATTFTSLEEGNSKARNTKGKIYTAEELYALMFMSQIPIEFEHRNLNRLLVVLRIMSNYNEPTKKMSQQDVIKQNRTLNEQRKAQMKTKG